MLKLTEQKAREFVTSKGGVVDKILEENGKHFFYITCKLVSRAVLLGCVYISWGVD